MLNRLILFGIIVIGVAIIAVSQNSNVIIAPTILDPNGAAILYGGSTGNAVLGKTLQVGLSTTGDIPVMLLNPSNGGFSTWDCDKINSGVVLPCQIQVGATAILTLTTGGGSTGQVIPPVDNVIQLGGPNNRFQNLYVGNFSILGSSTTDLVLNNPFYVIVGNNGGFVAAGATANASVAGLTVVNGSYVSVASNKTGTGTYLPMAFFTNGTNQFRITTAGAFKGQTTSATVGTTDGTFAQLPSSPTTGDCKWIHDANSVTFGAAVTAGSSTGKIFTCFDGTNWTVR